MNILEKITERTKERIEEEKKIVPLEEVRRQAEEKGIKDQIPAFEQALRADGLSFICEAKESVSIQRIDRTGFSICGDRQRL